MTGRFTLIEVLVAASISVIVLGIISGAAWSTLQTVSSTRSRIDVAMESAALVRRLSEDLRGSRLEVHRSREEESGRNGGGEQQPPPAFYAESGNDELRLDIYTTAAVTGPRMPAGFYRVSYLFDARNGALERRQAHIAQVEVDELPWRVVGDGLEFIEMRFFDGDDWLDWWDSDEEGDLPLSIEVRFGLHRNGSESRYAFTVSPQIRDDR